jgi:hypothetical protein
MVRERSRWLPILLAVLGLLWPPNAGAIQIDDEGTMNVSVRAYANVRVGTTTKQCTKPPEKEGGSGSFGGTFPCSGAGHLMQNRYFLEVEWDHDLLPWVEDYTPDWLTSLEYTLSYRGEYEGIYNFGPKEYSHNTQSRNELETFLRQSPTFAPEQLSQIPSMLYFERHRLREIANYRNRLFLAFIDFEVGDLFVRFGRQNLVWGETDVFRLLDNINPVDNSFGGFFIDLDERRVPLNMLRGSYFLGSLGPLDQIFLEGYGVLDNTVAFIPGAPYGSPWSTPLGPPVGRTLSVLQAPSNGFDDFRGGGRLVANVGNFTVTAASYFTMLDTQAVKFRAATPDDIGSGYQPGISVIAADQTAPRIWVNGLSMTTAIEDLKSILRGEFAWFRDEALFKGPTANAFPLTAQGQPQNRPAPALPIPGGNPLDLNYVLNFLGPVTSSVDGVPTPQFSTVSRKDTLNFSVGWDMNQYVRFLNPAQTFLFSTQFFYRRILNPAQCTVFNNPLDPTSGTRQADCQGLPVPLPNNSTRIVPLPANQFLQTLLINTTYNHNIPGTQLTVQTTPGLQMLYDWQGSLVFQPNVRIVRDPWRFIVDYTALNSGVYRYQLGLVRDRGNVRFQIEYVL